jgi:hypothetical protein
MSPKEIAKLIQDIFKQQRGDSSPWFVVGLSDSPSGDSHFVLFCENANCYCRVTVNSKKEIAYLKFHC